VVYIKKRKMSTILLGKSNEARLSTLQEHYLGSIAELFAKIKENPFQTHFIISAGCVSEAVASEICFRFNNEGLETKVVTSGIYNYTYTLSVTIPLPKELVHEKEEMEDVVTETTEEVVSEQDNTTTMV
jgi:hypothetical protein